jgi:hypothetical protein
MENLFSHAGGSKFKPNKASKPHLFAENCIANSLDAYGVEVEQPRLGWTMESYTLALEYSLISVCINLKYRPNRFRINYLNIYSFCPLICCESK